MKIGEQIKSLRKKRGMSVATLANRIGVNRATIYRYENGDIDKLPYKTIVPIAEALGVSPTYFFGFSEDEIKDLLSNDSFIQSLREIIPSQ